MIEIELTPSIERYSTYWASRTVQVRQELHLFPPKSQLEEDVFTVRNPQYWRLYEWSRCTDLISTFVDAHMGEDKL